MASCLDLSIMTTPYAIASLASEHYAIASITSCPSTSHNPSAMAFSIAPAPRNSAQQIRIILTTSDPGVDLMADTLTLEFFDLSLGGPFPLFSKVSGVGITNVATSNAARREAIAKILPSDWIAVETAGLSFGDRVISVRVNLWITRGSEKSLVHTGVFESFPNTEVIT